VVSVGCGVASRRSRELGPALVAPAAHQNGTPVPVAQLTGKEVLPCADGYAHPNICCRGAPYLATTCTEDLTRPFDDCQAEQLAVSQPKRLLFARQQDNLPAAFRAMRPLMPGKHPTAVTLCSPGAYPPPPFLDGHLVLEPEYCSAGRCRQDPPPPPRAHLCTGPVHGVATHALLVGLPRRQPG